MSSSVVSTPPLTAPGSAGAMKRLTMSPSVEGTPGGRVRGVSREGNGRLQGSAASVTDYMKPVVKSAARRWKRLHEQNMMEQLVVVRQDKKLNDRLSKEEAKKVARKIPVEVLARDWLNDNQATIEVRAYLVDKVLPTLILGCEKLLTEVDSKELATKEDVEPNFNPINFLAQYLMRNNPRYSNFSESSPYVRGLRDVSEQLRKELFKLEDNRLARIKADVKRRQEERERQEELKVQEQVRRAHAFMKQFVEWNNKVDGYVELALIQSALLSFAEVMEAYPEELRAAAQYSHELQPTDESGFTLKVEEFCLYLQSFVENLPTDVFDHFLAHLNRCADDHRAATEQEGRRIVLTNLFISCDRSGIGLLDRHRVLQLFEQFFDNVRGPHKSKFRNPRRWPVVEVEEAEEGEWEDELEDLNESTIDLSEGGDTQTAKAVVTEQSAGEQKQDADTAETVTADDVTALTDTQKETKPAGDQPISSSSPSPPAAEITETANNLTPSKTDGEGDEKKDEEKPEEGGVAPGEGDSKTEDESNKEKAGHDEGEKEKDESIVNPETSEGTEPTVTEESIEPIEEAEAKPEESEAAKTEKAGENVAQVVTDQADMGEGEVTADTVQSGTGPDTLETVPELGEEDQAALSNAGRISVSFAEGTVYERERTGITVTSRSLSQASAFDESSLNVSQFVQLTETFLNDNPPKEAFDILIKFLKDQYVETEDEKLKRLLKARQDAISAKRKLLVNSLFEKWDNDGSGYLDMDEVEAVMLKYKDGQETEAIQRAGEELQNQSDYKDRRLSKREFRTLLEVIVEEMPGADSFDHFVEFLTNSVERTYAERIRGEARKKWLQQIVTAGETGGSSMEPVYMAVFMALYKDAESHGGGKKISANIGMLEKNSSQSQRGDVCLRYVAATPEDADLLLGKSLYKDEKGISFSAVDTGKPIHVPRVNNHGNIHFWDTNRKENSKDGSFIVVPLKDRRKRVFGLMGVDTLSDPHSKAIFITHEIQYFQGVAKAFSIAYHHVDIRKKLLRITESAISWIYRRSPHMNEITMYLVEPDGKTQDYILRKMMMTDDKGNPQPFEPPPRLERKDNLFRDYLFKCVDNSETVSADAYGERHLAIPLRDELGRAVAIVDIGIGELKKLPAHEIREVQRMLKLLQMAHREITKELAGEEKTTVLEVEKDDDSRVDVMFDRLMLMELRNNVSKLDSRSYSELRSYNEPPKVIQDILKAVLSIFYLEQAEAGEFDDWTNVKAYINGELSQRIWEYDPTASEVLIPAEKVMGLLKDVPHGAVAKHGSLPAQHMYNWVFVCLSLIEHTRKMRETSQESLPDNNTGGEITRENTSDEQQQSHK